jgi:hypothetical protein
LREVQRASGLGDMLSFGDRDEDAKLFEGHFELPPLRRALPRQTGLEASRDQSRGSIISSQNRYWRDRLSTLIFALSIYFFFKGVDNDQK